VHTWHIEHATHGDKRETDMMKSERYEIAKRALIEKKLTWKEYEALLDAIDTMYRKPK
jgi:hypothetical protein